MLPENLIIEELGTHHNRTEFSCGIQELDRYIKEQANQDVKRKITRIFVASSNNKVVGFYTLSAMSVSRDSLTADIVKKIPKYPVPAVLLGRLAADKTYQGKHLGKALIINAIKRVLSVSLTIGVYALIVDAKNDTAASFYKHFGFIEFANNPKSLFLPLATMKNLVD